MLSLILILKIVLRGADLKYLIEGNIPFELFETVKYEGGTNEDKTNYKTMFLEIVKEMYDEVRSDDGSVTLEATNDINNLLTYWTGGRTFPKSNNNPIKITNDVDSNIFSFT